MAEDFRLRRGRRDILNIVAIGDQLSTVGLVGWYSKEPKTKI